VLLVKANGGETMTTQTHHERRWTVMLLAVILAAGLLALAWPAARPADAAQFKFVAKTFERPGFIDVPGGGSIGPALPYPSVRFIGDLGFPKGARIVDVNLTLKDFGHSAPDDVDMMLAHKGVNRTVMSDVGGFDNVDNLNLILDDEAQTALSTSLLAGGRFKPLNSGDLVLDGFPAPAPTQNPGARLSGFDGKNPEGSWKLFIQDDTSFDSGLLGEGWSLRIRAKYPTN